ncbi:MAG: hypothetical protein VX681_17015 [Myxococcota bacterium]|nr:hypothetical protein [Myxococcota bacterium]
MTDPFEQAPVDERYAPPTFEMISLDCEITSYAPDGDDSPLF